MHAVIARVSSMRPSTVQFYLPPHTVFSICNLQNICFFHAMKDTLNNLTNKLRRDIEHMPPSLQAAAKYIIDYPGDFGLNPIRLTAAHIGVSSNVLVRLAHRMGFDGFDAFREPFRQALVTDREGELGQDWLANLQSGDQLSQSQAKYAQNAQNVVTRSLRLMHPEKIRRAVDFITKSKRCFVTATRASYALSYYFSYVGRMAHPGIQLAPRHVGSAVDDLLDADHSDCLIAITVHPYSAETIQSMRFARQKGMKIILVSDSDVIAPKVEPDVTFPVSVRSLHDFSNFTGAMTVLDCILGHLFEAGGKDAHHRARQYQQARENTGAYWKPSKAPKIRKP
ncbi:MurR/RpiR family transcriptional regulator [Ruegeria sp. HKCCD7239]|uniref:MurR/RpiR family transcriptional regulator n=1 Tax=unclassified Ruegeria TaxID=2625375 RepID=UPI00352FF411